MNERGADAWVGEYSGHRSEIRVNGWAQRCLGGRVGGWVGERLDDTRTDGGQIGSSVKGSRTRT